MTTLFFNIKQALKSPLFLYQRLFCSRQNETSPFNAYKFEVANETLYSSNLHLRLEFQKASSKYTELLHLYESRSNELLFAHASATANENQYRSILDVMPQIAWTTDGEGWVNFINERWYEYTGLERTTSIVGSWNETVHPEDIEAIGARYLEILKSNSGGEFEGRTRRRDGVYRWFLTRMQAIRDQQGNALFWIGTATDIDDLKRVQQQKDDFINIASHELKTPLTSLKVAIQLLTERQNDADFALRSKLIMKAGQSLDKVINLVEDLLFMGTINKGNFILNKSMFLICDLLSEFEAALRHTGQFRLEYSGVPETLIFGDARRIEQVLVNLINNATKYAPASSVVRIEILELADAVIIAVIDRGPGIEAGQLKNIFDPYFQAGQNKHETSGLGLGLAISAEIIQLHAGSIHAESELGTGTRFWFSLPKKKSNHSAQNSSVSEVSLNHSDHHVTPGNLNVTSSDHHVTSSNLNVTSSHLNLTQRQPSLT